MALRLWERPSSPDKAAALMASRIVTVLGAFGFLYLAFRWFDYVDPRFAPGITTGLTSNPNFVLSAFILVPVALVLLMSTIRAKTCWIAAIFIVCVATLESFAFIYNNRAIASSPGLVEKSDGDPLQKTNCGKIGSCLYQNAHAHVVGTFDGKIVFDVVYNVDELGVRRSLDKDDRESRPIFLSLFGDSNTFGMNVSDQQTLGGQIGAIACATHPYNLALPGGSTSNMLAEFEENRVSQVIKQTNGYFVYVYNDGHQFRNVGDEDTLLFGKNFPAYDFDSNGGIAYMGTLWTYRVLRNALVVLAQNSNIVRALHIHLLDRRTDYHARLTAAMIDRSAEISREQFPDSKFVVLFPPDSQTVSDITKRLHDKDIRILDYSSLISGARTDVLMPDKHPMPIFYKEMAEQIAKDLGLETRCPRAGFTKVERPLR